MIKNLNNMHNWKDLIKYGVGEVLLVVIGILIALQINNWNENKKQRLHEIELVNLLITDLNSKVPVIIEPSGDHAILAGHGDDPPSLEYLAKDNKVENGNTIFTSGKEGLFSPGIPIGQVSLKADKKNVLLFSDISQISFVNINIGDSK